MIVANNISKIFNGFEALVNVSFAIKKGEVVGLLGENGAGKTTLIRILTSILKPSFGNACINNFDLLKEAKAVKKSIGVLLGADIGIYERLTARENILFFASLNSDRQKFRDIELLNNLAEKLDLSSVLDKRTGFFSRGMKQKVALIRAMIHNPPILFLDEPTVGLDPVTCKKFYEIIKDCAIANKTVIFSSHNIEEVKNVCNKVLILHKGRLLLFEDILKLEKDFQKDLRAVFYDKIFGIESEIN